MSFNFKKVNVTLNSYDHMVEGKDRTFLATLINSTQNDVLLKKHCEIIQRFLLNELVIETWEYLVYFNIFQVERKNVKYLFSNV